ncbi:MAG: hypothetical protein R2856_38370 [Caldilineaceae bacterium]
MTVNSVALKRSTDCDGRRLFNGDDVDGRTYHRLTVRHTPDDGAPGHIAIAPDFNTSGPVSATIRGVVRDISPVPPPSKSSGRVTFVQTTHRWTVSGPALGTFIARPATAARHLHMATSSPRA